MSPMKHTHRPLTTSELIALLADYPADTPVFVGRDSDLRAHQVTETTYDDWEHSTSEVIEGATYETPAKGTAVHIGPRF